MTHFMQNARPSKNSGRLRRAKALRQACAAGLERLEDRTFLSSTPTGAVTVLNRTTITGWAFNKDDGAEALNVVITVNGVSTTVLADLSQAGLPAMVGSPFHGFTFTIPTLSVPILGPGANKITVMAVSPSTGAEKVLKSATLTNPPPIGKVQTVSATDIIGWAFDKDSAPPNAAAPIQVRVDIDGVQGTPFTTDVVRNDLLKKYKVQDLGFDLTAAEAGVASFTGHDIEVYAIDAPSGAATLIFSNNKLAKGKVLVNDGFTVSGTAVDSNNANTPVNITVTVDGTTLSGTPVLTNATSHAFSVAIPGLTPGKHTISVFASETEDSSAKQVLIGSKSVTDAVPTGQAMVIGTNLVGWVSDADLKTVVGDPDASATHINVYADDQAFGPGTDFLADMSGVAGVAASHKGHEFSIPLSSLPAGSHSITVTAIDNRTSDQQEVVIYDNFIGNTKPIGAITSVDGKTITGWAYDPDADTAGAVSPAGVSAIYVDIYVDGVYAETTTANLPGSPMNATVLTPNHGFSVDLPTLSFGTHRIDVYAAESQGNVSDFIGSTTVTNNRPIGVLESATATTITGWAADPDRLGESVDIEVFVNGQLAMSGTADTLRNDLAGTAPLSSDSGFLNYGFALTLPTALSTGTNQVDVYAVDLNNGLISPLGSQVVIV